MEVTKWLKPSGMKADVRAPTSGVWGQAEGPGRKADVRALTSGAGGRAAGPATWPGLRLIAMTGSREPLAMSQTESLIRTSRGSPWRGLSTIALKL